MTLYLLFGGCGTLIYTGAAYANAYGLSFGAVRSVFGAQSAFVVWISIILVVGVVVYVNRLVRAQIIAAALVFTAGGAAILIATSREADTAGSVPSGDSRAAFVDNESSRALAAGSALFQERGCIGCHRADGTGIGPTLHGRFGTPVDYPGSEAGVVDESYLREAIANPTATVAEGFPPVMPTFAGQLTDEQLEALILYVKSLSVRVQG